MGAVDLRIRRFLAISVNPLVFTLLMLALPAFAAPRDVRSVLSKNGFTSEANLQGRVTAYPEPSLQSWPIGDQANRIFVTEFDPPPTNPKPLTEKQARQLASILGDRHTYSPSLGGKACGGFHADIAIRVPGEMGGLYILLCFTCNQISLRQYGQSAAFADMDRGRNRLLLFLRSILPDNKRFKELRLYKPEELERHTAKDVLEWAKTMIPDDPLLKHALTLKLEEIAEDDLEELDIRATAEMHKPETPK